jgi:hypothetical protein
MAKCILVNSASNSATSAGTTQFSPFGTAKGTSWSSTEANRYRTYQHATTLSNLFVRIELNGTTATSTLGVRKNGVNGALTVSIGAGATGVFEDVTNSDTVAIGDEMVYVCDTGAGGTLTVSLISVLSDPTSGNTIETQIITGSANLSNASETRYAPVNGGPGLSTTEANHKCRCRTAAVWENLYVQVSANARSTDTIFGSRKNGAAGSLTLTVGASATGVFEDLSNADTLAAGDDYNFFMTTGTGTGTLTFQLLSAEFVTTSRKFPLLIADGAGVAQAFNVTNYFPIAGMIVDPSTTETFQQLPTRLAITLSDLTVLVTANTIATSATTVTVRSNAGNTVLTVSIGAGATGVFEDLTNTVAIGSTESINYVVVTPNTSGSITIRNIGVTATVPVGGSEVLGYIPQIVSI